VTTKTSIQEAAADMRARFTLKTRASDDSRYWTHANQDDEQSRSLALYAHDNGSMLPNDWRYQFIVDALDILAEYEDDEYFSAVDLDTDTQWSTLADWLQSAPVRGSYVDDAIADGGYPADMGIWTAIAMGQLREREEVLGMVKSWLESNS
jgi:hypothetical protein